ncbi:hypothetical protein LGZ23_004115, partial [Salmonella enterica subsp. enterica serovar Cerro]|nr:hypothetical protein [Salmonella enterica subsp. enterica serovar Cerro]
MHLDMNFIVRKNLDGEYVIIHANQLKEGVEYAVKMGVTQVQIRGVLGSDDIGMTIDFRQFEKLSKKLKVISFTDKIDSIINFDFIYSLNRLEKIFFQKKQSFTMDVSLFPALKYLGFEYWKGVSNINLSRSLESLVVYKFNEPNLKDFLGLSKLNALHIYDSKISDLSDIESLSIKELYLVKNNCLKEVGVISRMNSLRK